jgi:hypothetical protein
VRNEFSWIPLFLHCGFYSVAIIGTATSAATFHCPFSFTKTNSAATALYFASCAAPSAGIASNIPTAIAQTLVIPFLRLISVQCLVS